MKCLICEHEIPGIEKHDLIDEVIECPNCHNKMIVEYDEVWHEGMDEEEIYWWLTQYFE